MIFHLKKELCFHYEINQEFGFLHIPFFFLRKEINIITFALISGDTSLKITEDFHLKINYFYCGRENFFLCLIWLIVTSTEIYLQNI